MKNKTILQVNKTYWDATADNCFGVLSINGQGIMAQSLEFYLRNYKDNNSLKPRIYNFLSMVEKKC